MTPHTGGVKHRLGLSTVVFLPRVTAAICTCLSHLVLKDLVGSNGMRINICSGTRGVMGVTLAIIASVNLIVLDHVTGACVRHSARGAIRCVAGSFRLCLYLTMPVVFNMTNVTRIFMPHFFNSMRNFNRVTGIVVVLDPVVFLVNNDGIFNARCLLPASEVIPCAISMFAKVNIGIIFGTVLVQPLKTFNTTLDAIVSRLTILVIRVVTIHGSFPIVHVCLQK